jgi:hypothetical protein
LKVAEHDPQEHLRREQSDFLVVVNHEREALDFHALRHTCEAWLEMTGAHPKAVQSIMRHSSITLTMDTYGHLFPGQEADTVARLPGMMGNGPEALRATGTCDAAAAADGAKELRIGVAVGVAVARRNMPDLAEGSETEREFCSEDTIPQVVALSGDKKNRRVLAAAGLSRPGRDRTSDQGIMSPLL